MLSEFPLRGPLTLLFFAENAKDLIASSDQLVKDFASQRFLAGISGDADDE